MTTSQPSPPEREPAPEKTDAAATPDARETTPKGAARKIASWIPFVLLVAVVLAIPRIVEQMSLRSMRPVYRDDYRTWRSQKIDLPPEASEAEPYAEATVEASEAFLSQWYDADNAETEAIYQAWEGHSAQKVPPALYNRQLPFDLDDLAQYRELFAAFERLVARPDYDIDAAWSALVFNAEGDLPDPFLRPVGNTARLLALKAVLLCRAGRGDEALDLVVPLAKAARAHAFAPMISQQTALSVAEIAQDALHYVASNTEDPALLRRALAIHDAHFPKEDFLPEDVPLYVSDLIGMYRSAVRRGAKVKLEGNTPATLTASAWFARGEYLKQTVLPRVQNRPQVRVAVEQNIQHYQRFGQTLGMPGYFSFGLRAWTAPAHLPNFYPRAAGNRYESLVSRQRLLHSRNDLLRLGIARRLHGAENGGEPADRKALVPAYLARWPADNWRKDEGDYGHRAHDYSVGPDLTDDRGEVAYDPTNGLISRGDVYLAPLPKGEVY